MTGMKSWLLIKTTHPTPSTHALSILSPSLSLSPSASVVMPLHCFLCHFSNFCLHLPAVPAPSPTLFTSHLLIFLFSFFHPSSSHSPSFHLSSSLCLSSSRYSSICLSLHQLPHKQRKYSWGNEGKKERKAQRDWGRAVMSWAMCRAILSSYNQREELTHAQTGTTPSMGPFLPVFPWFSSTGAGPLVPTETGWGKTVWCYGK